MLHKVFVIIFVSILYHLSLDKINLNIVVFHTADKWSSSVYKRNKFINGAQQQCSLNLTMISVCDYCTEHS